MKQHNRHQEKINLRRDLENDFLFIKDMKFAELENCTHYRAQKNGDVFRPGKREQKMYLNEWRDIVSVLYNKKETHHNCHCFETLFSTIEEKFPYHTQEMWQF